MYTMFFVSQLVQVFKFKFDLLTLPCLHAHRTCSYKHWSINFQFSRLTAFFIAPASLHPESPEIYTSIIFHFHKIQPFHIASVIVVLYVYYWLQPVDSGWRYIGPDINKKSCGVFWLGPDLYNAIQTFNFLYDTIVTVLTMVENYINNI